MNIQFEPQGPNHPPDKKAHTNVGEYYPGQIRTLTPEQEEEGKKLVENGDFKETTEAENMEQIAAEMPDKVKAFHEQAKQRHEEEAQQRKERNTEPDETSGEGTDKAPATRRGRNAAPATS